MGAAISYKYTNSYSATRSYRKMTIRWEEMMGILNDPYEYLDDAVDMPSGKGADAVRAWQEFFGYRPCLFKNGRVVGYLNPNDFSKFEDGTDADITSGNAGDVMIEFPRRGIKITRVDKKSSNNVIKVSMTDDPDNPDYSYYAHTRGSNAVNYFYISAYLASDLKSSTGSNGQNQLYSVCIDPKNTSTNRLWYGDQGSLSGLNETSDAKTLLANKGDNYDLLTFQQIIFLQVMCILQFKHPNPQNSVKGLGIGYCDSRYSPDESVLWPSFDYTTTKGMMYEGIVGGSAPIKLFGLDNMWSSTPTIFTGLAIHVAETDYSYLGEYRTEYYIATDNFYYDAVDFTSGSLNVTKIGYTKVGSFERPIDSFDYEYTVNVTNPTTVWWFPGHAALGFFPVGVGRFSNERDGIYFANAGPVYLVGDRDKLYDGVLGQVGVLPYTNDTSRGGIFATRIVGKKPSTLNEEQAPGLVRFCYF